MTYGRFITFEGGEGCGKTTQSKQLFSWLQQRGIPAIHTREPGGSVGAERLRTLLIESVDADWDPVCEVLLFTVARRHHVQHTILPALQSGTWVVCDRFYDSTVAYQAFGNALGRTLPDMCHQLAIGNLQPDLTLILDIPVEEGLVRARKVTGDQTDRFESREMAFHERLRQGFHTIAHEEPARCKLLDASASIDTIHQQVCALVSNRFALV